MGCTEKGQGAVFRACSGYMEMVFHHEVGQVLEEVTQKSCGIFILENLQNSAGTRPSATWPNSDVSSALSKRVDLMILQDPFQMGLLCDPVWVCLYMYKTENSDHVKCGGRRCNIYVKVCKRICKKKSSFFIFVFYRSLWSHFWGHIRANLNSHMHVANLNSTS